MMTDDSPRVATEKENEVGDEVYKIVFDAIDKYSSDTRLCNLSNMQAVSILASAAIFAAADAAVIGALREGREPKLSRFLRISRLAFRSARERFRLVFCDEKTFIIEFREVLGQEAK